MRLTGDRVAVLAAALVWLVMLGFPVTYALSGPAPGVQVGVALGGLALLVGVYLPAVFRVARDGAPRPAPLSLAVVATVAIALPLVVGGAAWFGGTLFLAALLGLSLPARQALIGVAVATGLSVAQAVLTDAPPAQAVSVPLVTAVAGVIVVVVVRQTTLARELAASRRTAERLAAQAERLRLARELHDSVKQQAFVAALELASARSRFGADEHLDAAADAVATVQRQLGEIIEHVRPLRRELVPALREHLADWSRRTGVATDLAVRAAHPPPAQSRPAEPLAAESLSAEPLLPVAAEALTSRPALRGPAGSRHAHPDGRPGRARDCRRRPRVRPGPDAVRPGTARHARTPGRARRHAERALGPRRHYRHRARPGGRAVITVLVAEDHPLVRRGIVGFLATTQPDLVVVAEAGDGAEAVRLAVEHCPDVAVIDLQLPRVDGVETIRRLTRDCPGIRVVVLTSHEGDADIFPAIHAGALSYLLKEATPDELAGAVRAAAAGEAVLHPRVAARVVAELRSGRPETPNALRDLTGRELEVLRLLGEGLPNDSRPTSGRRRRLVATTALIGCAAAVALSGFAQWAGLAAAIPWHAGSSSLFVVLATGHAARRLWRVRRRYGATRDCSHTFTTSAMVTAHVAPKAQPASTSLGKWTPR